MLCRGVASAGVEGSSNVSDNPIELFEPILREARLGQAR
jgi:hypothetical protein